MEKFDITKYKLLFNNPDTISDSSAWIEHIPFSFFLIEILKPAIFVELGTHTGSSFNAFCQAVKTLNINTECYAVDTWEGDEHVGFYSDNIFLSLSDYQAKHYKTFASLMKMTFDEACLKFNDETIDLLHIDGLHTYEAVKHDFLTWLPKMSKKGVIIFHDTSVKREDFGVWKLWEEISSDYVSFSFHHGSGLGILAVGPEVSQEFLTFIKSAQNDKFYQLFFEKLGAYVLYSESLNNTRKELLKTWYELEMIKKSKTWIWGRRIANFFKFFFLRNK